jgi:predicted Zn-dependent protease
MKIRSAGRRSSVRRRVSAAAASVLAVASLALLSGACATNPVTGRREFTLLSEAQEIALGRESDAQIKAEMGVYDDPELQRYVSDLGLRLARLSERPTLPWQFTVVDQPAINAFALPGGFIYVTRGILPYLADEAELVGVLGHEIGHVTARHSVRQYSRAVGGQLGLTALGAFVPASRAFSQASETALGLMFLKYGREDELQSDQLGARYAASAGWDPGGVPGMLSTLGRLDEAAGDRKGVPNFLSTHPEPLARVAQVQPAVEGLRKGRAGLVTDRDALLRQLDGVVFGDSPEQGIVRGSTMLHPPLRFRIDFPPNWDVANGAQQVVAKAPLQEIYMLLQIAGKAGGSLQDTALGGMQRAGFRPVEGRRTAINGLDAFTGLYRGQVQGLGAVACRAAHIVHGGQVYLIAGLAAPDGFPAVDGTFTASMQSFRPLSAAEAERIRPNRLALYVARAGDTWASLAERSAGAIRPAALAIMNGAAPGSPPVPGTRYRIVSAG